MGEKTVPSRTDNLHMTSSFFSRSVNLFASPFLHCWFLIEFFPSFLLPTPCRAPAKLICRPMFDIWEISPRSECILVGGLWCQCLGSLPIGRRINAPRF